AAGFKMARPAYTCHLLEYIRRVMLILTFSMPPIYRGIAHGNCWFAAHAVLILRNAACVTACVSAVMRSCISPVRYTIFDSRQDKIRATRSTLFCEALC